MRPDWVAVWRTVDAESKARFADHIVFYGVGVVSAEGEVLDPTKTMLKPRVTGSHLVISTRVGWANTQPVPEFGADVVDGLRNNPAGSPDTPERTP